MDVKDFQRKAGYFFKNDELLKEAFTHTSYANEHKTKSYERLEFLGDAIVDMIVAEYLYTNHSELDEGDMSRVRASLVCEKALCDLATQLGLDRYMLLGNGAEISGYRNNASILSDMFEALVAAIYLDAGFSNARDYVLAAYGEKIDESVKNGDFVDYKTKLQEKLQQNGPCEIMYEQVSATGPVHHCLFEIRVVADGKALGTGKAYSKKEAQQAAAKEAFLNLK